MRHDILTLQTTEVDFGEISVRTLVILINNQNLIDLAREVELPFAQEEGNRDLAGSYMGLPVEKVLLPSRYLLGEVEDGLQPPDKTTLLACGGCGEPDCWALRAKITLTDTQVMWSDFCQHQRHNRKERLSWQYDLLGPFTFDRKQYESAL